MTRETRFPDLAAKLTLEPTRATRQELTDKALSVALKMLAPYQPGDSRAVDNWFVACAAVEANLDDWDGKIEKCLDEALLLPDVVLEPVHVHVTFGDDIRPPENPELEAMLEWAKDCGPMSADKWKEQRARMAHGLIRD